MLNMPLALCLNPQSDQFIISHLFLLLEFMIKLQKQVLEKTFDIACLQEFSIIKKNIKNKSTFKTFIYYRLPWKKV